ncbi:MAG TPA: hypothetical protein VN086_03065 [Candidatus Paceibacterota bacterium]|nr:hypothetical protein [Candidatus Paceibacterota bacterium]
MLQEKISSATAFQSLESPKQSYMRRVWSKKRRRWLYIYAIYPSKDAPFLPSDEAIISMISHLPEVAFMESIRDKDMDRFLVFQLKKGIFSTRADRSSRELRKKFLSDIAQASSSQRSIRPATSAAVQRFLEENDFASVEWTGGKIVAYSKEGGRYESTQVRNGSYRQQLRVIHRICKIELPFYHGAAP